MSDTETIFVVRIDRRPACTFVVVIMNNQASFGLSPYPNDGELFEPELRTLLADKYRISASDIEALIQQANEYPAIKPTSVKEA
jgi:hypothetical protein